jgi:hypothetical protein
LAAILYTEKLDGAGEYEPGRPTALALPTLIESPPPPAYPVTTTDVMVEKAIPLFTTLTRFAPKINDVANTALCPLAPTPVTVTVPAVI